VSQYASGPLPFLRVDLNNPQIIESLWNVTESGDAFDDNMRGAMYCDLLVHRMKNWRHQSKSKIDPFPAISDVMMAIARKGNPGPIENGFFSRAAMLMLAASLN
jgi:hypothetical protein